MFEGVQNNACNIFGRNNGMESWSWEEYRENKEKYKDQIVLCDMINQPIEDSIPLSEEILKPGAYPDGTVFVLYCHSGGSSGYIQMQLTPQFPQFKFVNMSGGILAYN